VVTLEVNRQDILKMFAYHSLCDSLKSNSRKIKMNWIKDREPEKCGGAKIPLKRSVLNADHRAYRRLSGLIGFSRPAEFGLYQPRLLPVWPALAWPVGNTVFNKSFLNASLDRILCSSLAQLYSRVVTPCREHFLPIFYFG